MAEHETDSESENDQEPLDIDLLLNMESDNKWLDSPQQIYLVTISKFPTEADFSIEIQRYKINSSLTHEPWCLVYHIIPKENLHWKQKLIRRSRLRLTQQTDQS